MNNKIIFNTILEMFEERKYIFLENDDECIISSKNNGKLICAFIPLFSSKFNVEKYQIYTSIAKKMDINHILIVYKDTITSQAKKMVELSPDIDIELFNEDELKYNITKHIYVPKHSLYAKKGSKKIEEFKNKDLLPIILKNDPICRFYNFQKGDIIKIIRHNGIIIFRIVK